MKLNEMFGGAIWVWDRAVEEGKAQISILRGRFSVSKAERATLRVVGLGVFHCYINGVRVGEDLFLPLNSEYESKPNYPADEVLSGYHLYVPEYDITHMLKEGENTIAIHFGGGWYTAVHHNLRYGHRKAIWRVFGEGADGTFDFGSSEADKIADSFVTGYHLTQLEAQEYTHENVRALEEDFDDSAWEHAVSAPAPETEYDFSDCPADRVCEVLPVKEVGRTEDSVIYDCGKNTTGYPVLRLTGARGDEVSVAFSEEVTPDGTLDYRFHHWQNIHFVCDGSERLVHPLFTWFGFRYFAVAGNAHPVSVEVVHTNAQRISSFHSDNELLNWIHDAYVNTQLTNMHMGIPSDCPHIERRGYTGDGQLTCHAAMTTLDTKEFYRKWMRDIADGQDTLTGHVQYTAPYLLSGGGPGGWGAAIVEVPYRYYKHYGDTSILEEYYPRMLRYMDFLEAHSENDLVVSDKAGAWCLGDWCCPVEVALPAPFVNNYFYIKCLTQCIEIARAIGKEEDIPAMEEKINAKRKATTAAYFNTWDSNFLGARQGANAYALDMGIGDGRTYTQMVAYYRRTGHFDTGIFGTDILTRVLFERGDGQLACDLLLSTHKHSFAEWKRRGATTFWEYWPESLIDRSHNHPMFGAVAAYLYDYLLGIRAKDGCAGYTDITIAPVIVNGVNTLSGHRTLPAGKVSLSYEKSEGGISFCISIPEGQKAEFVYGENTYPLSAGENRFTFEA